MSYIFGRYVTIHEIVLDVRFHEDANPFLFSCHYFTTRIFFCKQQISKKCTLFTHLHICKCVNVYLNRKSFSYNTNDPTIYTFVNVHMCIWVFLF